MLFSQYAYFDKLMTEQHEIENKIQNLIQGSTGSAEEAEELERLNDEWDWFELRIHECHLDLFYPGDRVRTKDGREGTVVYVHKLSCYLIVDFDFGEPEKFTDENVNEISKYI